MMIFAAVAVIMDNTFIYPMNLTSKRMFMNHKLIVRGNDCMKRNRVKLTDTNVIDYKKYIEAKRPLVRSSYKVKSPKPFHLQDEIYRKGSMDSMREDI
ncbi:hypothetical protein PAECIP111802_04142 [Paenibacillus allorhizosphaerae]|uniref:Uncharacterized protein n=1 Tax=Paenibacillus allorhizosphaerae TaxID=2849866 RepID=A0ABM8VL87_9BACL|nr:hypothetical protein PAECIP111802_04142 [Paenibacillus allorhizosphaerae]